MIFKFKFYKSLELIKNLIKSIYSTIVYFLGSMLTIYLGEAHLFKNKICILYFLKLLKKISKILK